MSLSTLLSDNVLLRWLTGKRRWHDLAASMVALKLGDRAIVLGGTEPGLVAALGSKVGFTGRTCAVDADAAVVRRAGAAVERAGVLAEIEHASWTGLPYGEGEFDVAVVHAVGTLASLDAVGASLVEVYRVLRPGGRCVILVPAPRRGTPAVEPQAQGAPPAALLSRAGFRAARLLADREGWTFLEGVKAG
jgi:SAM-dependent methyltransferase